MLDKREQLLLRLLFSGKPYTESDISVLLKDLDLDKEHMEYPLMLSILAIRNDWRYFPEKIRPRLSGINQAARLRNIYGVPWLKERLKYLEDAGIQVMLLKGMAMRAYYAPEFPRQMADFDLAVPEDSFTKAQEVLLRSIGSESPDLVNLHADHITDGQEKNMDLHKWVFKTGAANNEIWDKAVSVNYHGAKVSVPDAVDMVLHIVDSKGRDEMIDMQPERRMKWVFDMRCIISKAGSWDWESVVKRAGTFNSMNLMKMMMPEFSEVFPDVLSKEELEKYFPQDKEYLKWHNKIVKMNENSRIFSEYLRVHGNNRFTLRRIMLSFRFSRNMYRYYYEKRYDVTGHRMGFWKYYCLTHGVENMAGLWKKYIQRMGAR